MEAATWKSTQGLRGDYTNMAVDWTVPQVWSNYGTAEHAMWQRLCERQTGLVRRYAAPEYLETLDKLEFGAKIPRLEEINRLLARRSGWEIVGVPGFLPDEIFFRHLAERRFPVTVWIRTPAEIDYIVEPDIFHDLFGHVPLLANPVFGDFMQLYGQRAREAEPHGGTTMLSRLYWYSVEFGLIRGKEGLKAYGAGLLSSPGEIVHALESPEPQRVPFNLLRCMRTGFKIDEYQKRYFFIDSYRQLFESFEKSDVTTFCRHWRDAEPLDPGATTVLH